MAARASSYLRGNDFSGMLARKALLQWVREFLEKCSIEGSFWEFGVFQGESLKEAFYIFRDQMHFYLGFDSFEGLPLLEDVDRKAIQFDPHLVPGNYRSFGENFVRENILSCGMPQEQLLLFAGFYEDILKRKALRDTLADEEKHPAVIHIDVDLYSSTSQVLDFVYPYLKTGCWILFDDYWCFGGASRYGAQRAIGEFLKAHSDIRLQDYSSYRGWSKAFIVEKIDDA